MQMHEEFWTPKRLWRLTWPLVVEQLLLVTMGMADTAMVSNVGEAAVSGVSLVDTLNVLLISLFSALATGGAVVASQYIGRREVANASRAAKQLVYSIVVASTVIAILCLVFYKTLLQLVYPGVEAEVMRNAEVYFVLSAVSYPFLALYNAGASLFRSMGNSRMGMYISILVNLINIGGNALLIYGLGWGVAGAGTSTLVSRMVAGVLLMVLLLRAPQNNISLHGLWPPRFDKALVGSILKIGLPNALEGSVFQVGKVWVMTIVTVFGTAAVAANAIAGSIASFVNLAGSAIGMALLTVVGQCVGAKDFAGAKKQTFRLMMVTHVTMFVAAIVLFFTAEPLLTVFGLSAEGEQIAVECLRIFCICVGFTWAPAFALPNALRAAGDATFTMAASLLTMFTFRIGSAYLFAYVLNMGTFGVWVAMVVDWAARSAAFLWRWAKGKWQSKRVIG